MTEEFLETIFDAFTRAENSTTNKVQGTGLGMAITKNIVELMGGMIQVYSEVDQGSLFTVDLEFRLPEIEADEKFWEQKGITRLLVVDDEPDICETVRLLMEDTGVHVEAAHDWEEALRMRTCENGRDYDVVLLDWKMPRLDGIETARRMKKACAGDVPILLMTAHDWEDLQEEAMEAGIDGFLPKPFFVAAFKEKIIEILGERGLEEVHPFSLPMELGSLKGRHFLVAEDNEINAEIIEELLDIEEATCEIVENGELAVERFSKEEPGSFDAVLMDIQMPVMNGYGAARAIRALERQDAKLIPIIAMTANAFAEDVKDAMDAGMDAHIAKPVDMELLKQTLSLYLR